MKLSFSSILLLSLPFLFSCENNPSQQIVDESIEAHGGDRFKEVTISFVFRNRAYEIFKSENEFRYIRAFQDSTGNVRDELTDQGFSRTVNGDAVKLTEERINTFTSSVNSVAYFAYLPYGLNDMAAIKSYEGESEINNKTYDVVRITFKEDGGGEDFDDVFLYWFNQETHLLDYLAYSYNTEGGGVRFREATRRHEIEGLILTDYINYEPLDKNTPLEDMERLFKEGELQVLSEINLENIEVKRN